MHYTKFMDKSLSLLGMGCMRLPQQGEGWGKPVDIPKAEELLDYCMKNGVNYFDTAYVYHGGDSEVFLGKVLQKYPRESYYLADKYNLLAQPDYRIQFPEQLERLQTDYIDFYMCHGISDNYISGYLGNGGVEYFAEEKERGRIKHLGFSFHGKPEVLREALKYRDWDFVMIQLNYYDWFHGQAREQYEVLREHNIPIMVMEPVHGGMLTNLTDEGNAMLRAADAEKSAASWAMRFVMNLPGVVTVLSGMSDMTQVRDNVATFKERKPITEDDKAMLEKAAALLLETIGAKCTFCRYCDGCPHELDIPEILRIYNDFKAGGDWRLRRLTALDEGKRPSACDKCGVCVGQCPQGLDIPRYMEEMAGFGY